jgi:hypothetical protein
VTSRVRVHDAFCPTVLDPEDGEECYCERTTPVNGSIESVTVEVNPAGGLQPVRHNLGTEYLVVETFAGEEPIGHAFWAAITADEIEVSTVPRTTRVVVTIAPPDEETSE